jgi:subtilase family serine protease
MNKRNYFLSFLLIVSMLNNLNSQTTYCASKGNAPWTEWIANVQFGTINNTSSKEGYGNFTSQTTTVAKGTSYPLSILQGFSWAADPTNATQQGKVWIDYNQNGTFEANELAASTTRTTATANITIPTTALTGATRMRVSLKTIGAPTACEVFDKGEVEDYSVNITGGTVGGTSSDLTISGGLNVNIVAGQTLKDGQLYVANRGNGIATAPFTVNLYLSTDALLSANDRLLSKTTLTTNVIAGDSVLIPADAFSIPADVVAGTYQFIFKADGDNNLTESSELNNLLIQSGTVRNPNLTAFLTAFPNITPDQTVTRGNEFNLIQGLNSFGSGTPRTDSFGVRAYFSRDTFFSADDYLIRDFKEYFRFDATTTGFAFFQTALVPANFANGVYYIVYELDYANTVLETNETDNKSSIRINWVGGTVSGTPNLAITNVTGPATAAPGSQITLAVTVTNTGTAPTVATKLYYIQRQVNPEAPLPLTDNVLTIAPLSPNETRVINYVLTLKNAIYPPNANYLAAGFSPYDFGNYNVVASNEPLINGRLFPLQTDASFKFNFTPIFKQADISVNVVPSKTILQRQEKWNAVYTVKNNSNTLINQVFVNLGTFNLFSRNYIPSNYQIDSIGGLPANSFIRSSGGEYRTVGWELFELAAGETRELKLFFSNVLTNADFVTQYLDTARTTLPFPKVNAFSNVVNTNTTVGADIKIICYPQISATLPDLTLVNYNVPIPSVQQGQILNFNFDLINIGAVAATGNFNIKSYLSKDLILSADDYQDGIVPTANLGASVITRGVAGAMTVSNAVPAGQYYLILKVDADNQITESNENNNELVSYSSITVTSAVNNSCRFQDSLQLVRLYNATGGANWTRKWNLNTPIDTWTGISINPDGCVRVVALSNNNLVGTLPNLNLPKVEYLGLEQNKISGALPNLNLPNLTQLFLNENQFSGAIPNFNLPNVTDIYLRNNQLSGAIPNFNLPKLTGLFLEINQLSGSIPNFNLIPNLKILVLYANQLSGAIPNFNIPTIVTLALDSNRLTGTIPNFNLPNLVNLSLVNNQLTGSIPSFNFPLLAYLHVEKNQLSGCIPLALKAFCGKNVDISANPNLATQDFAAFCSANNTGACSVSTAYCPAKGTAPWEYWVGNVSLGTINNTSDKFKDFATLGYSDYTSLSTTLNKGTSYPLSISPGLSWIGNLPNAYIRAWIDFNDNKVFDNNEIIYAKNNATSLIENVFIPLTAATGNVRMRVALKFGAYPTACETFDRGEVEDYTVNIQGGGVILPCTPNLKCPSDTTIIIQPTEFAYCPSLDGRKPTFDVPACGAFLNSLSLNQQSCLQLGVTPLTWTMNFSNGSTASCTFNVTIQQQTPNTNGPDLTIANLNVPTRSVQQGQILNFKADLKNIGNAAATGSFTVKSYLSTIPVFNNRDYQDGVISTANFAAGFTSTQVPGAMTVSSAVAAGQYYLILKIDADNQITETNETNNYIVSAGLITVTSATTGGGADLALSIVSTPSVYRKYSVNTIRVTAQNVGNQALTNVKVELKRPALTSNGGTKVASVGTFQDFCPGGIECSEWTIPTLAAGATATLDAPFFVLDATAPIVVTTKLLSSTPTDANTVNNTATVSISPAAAGAAASILALSRPKPSQFMPIVVQSIEPTLTDGNVTVRLESIVEKEVSFNIYNTMGKQIFSEKRKVEKGENLLNFDVSEFAQGVYLIAPESSFARNAPSKFVKF